MPVLQDPDSDTVPEDDTPNVEQQSVLLNDTDADGDSLIAVLASGSIPQHATYFDLFPNGRFIYEPITGYSGSDSFQYEAYDGLDCSNPVTVTINVSNQPPTVQSASYTLPAVATTVAAASGVLATATDPFGYPLTAFEDSGPSSLALNSDGSFTYTPTAAAPYSDSFIFHASDGVNPSATATVTLNIEDALPSPGPSPSDGSTYTYAVQPGGSTSWTAAAGVLSAATDPYGYPLTATEGTPPNGTLTLNSDGSFTYTPPSTSFTGPDTFTYTVNDGVYTSGPATVTINVNSTEQPTADTGAAYTYAVPPNQLLTTTSSDGILARAIRPLWLQPDRPARLGLPERDDQQRRLVHLHHHRPQHPDGQPRRLVRLHSGHRLQRDRYLPVPGQRRAQQHAGNLHDQRRQHRAPHGRHRRGVQLRRAAGHDPDHDIGQRPALGRLRPLRLRLDGGLGR